MKNILLVISILISLSAFSQKEVPAVYANIHYDENGKLYAEFDKERFYAKEYTSKVNLSNMTGSPTATKEGIKFNFNNPKFKGKMYFGLINYNDSKHPSPVFFKRTASIEKGKSEILVLKQLSGIYDMTGWKKSGKGTLGYRVLNSKGELMYDGIISFLYKEGSFHIAPTITEGPFISKTTHNSTTIWYNTNLAVSSKVKVGKNVFKTEKGTHHEVTIKDLEPNKKYKYTVNYGELSQNYEFKTALKPGSQESFTFAYASDSRAGAGGGERDLYGTNFYIMRKISALAMQKDVAFMQFTGDLINGYSIDKGNINLQYANWKRSIEPYGHWFPIIPAPGNHEACGFSFVSKEGERKATVSGFPFETHSSSAIFAENFVNPTNGPVSEDGANYDPNKSKIDFPPYNETAFHYTYGNVAMIVLNSNYWYAPSVGKNSKTGGNLHAYIMDNQLDWLKKTIDHFENDNNIDHIFLTHHTPAFPNGGHVGDDMWYNGNNDFRPSVAGKKVKKGIIERRDEYLNTIINESSKVRAMLTGDEHNYNKVKITPKVNIYPKEYAFKKLKRKRTIWQINNGAAGAPYYAQDTRPPWTNAVSGFSTQNALVFITVKGRKVSVKVINPDTLEAIDEYEIGQ